MPRVASTVSAHGDYYPTVRAWMARLGVSHLDIHANERIIDERTARLYVKAITPKTKVTFRKMRSAGLGSAESIVLSKVLFQRGRGTLGLVLHECAHAIQNAKWKQRAEVRLEKRSTGKPLVGRNSIKAHGEAFCRTYARLLREVLS